MADGLVSVSRHIEAPAERLFALLADSANHPLIDGSGMVREPAPAVRLSGTGDVFRMNMYHADRGAYQMRNEVVEYQAGHRLAWEPVRVEVVASGPGEQEVTGEPAWFRWRFELSPDGAGAAVVTETFDCSRSPEELREAVRDGEEWRDAMTASLVKLELLARAVGPA
ncbi:MAG TPA: SRPBCC family protein [Streptosporangiaceae bacterium]